MIADPLTVYVGYDKREDDAFQVCCASLRRHASIPLNIVRLDVADLSDAAVYTRQWFRRSDGQRVDCGDNRPFSTDFAFSRFLVPPLSLYQGWSLFCDSDFLFTGDIARVMDYAAPRYAALCVKHDHVPREAVKMGGEQQSAYPRKNWSSFVLFNNAHPANRSVSVETVSKMPGRWLHRFRWLDDDKIGALPAEWNWLAGVDPEPNDTPLGIHFTLGVPTMPGCENAPYASLWRAERDLMNTPRSDARRHRAGGLISSRRLKEQDDENPDSDCW